ncbi:hypothetical protein ACWEKT_00540 [Nocardia takedensis]
MLLEAAVVGAGAGALLGLGHYRQIEKQISSDGDRYLTLGRGDPVPYPFMYRWLIPIVCRDSVPRWRMCTDLHLLALPILTCVYIARWESDTARLIVGSLLICGFAGIWQNNIRRPVLVDPMALTWALGAAVLSGYGWWPAAQAVAVVAACMKETAPAFAAAFALDPLLLIGLAAPIARRLLVAAGPDTHQSVALADPFGSARAKHAPQLFDPLPLLAPWGAGLIAILIEDAEVMAVLMIALTLAYGQLLVAVNTVRLYQWAAPAVALAAATVIPPRWAVVVLLAHLFNPFAGDGR